MGHDPGEFPAYFNTVENLFTLYEVRNKLRSKLVMPMLNDKSKSLLARLPREKLDNYEEVHDYLLRKFRLTPQQYRDRFYSGVKKPEETYTLFGSRLKTLMLYYLESRKAASKDEMIDLLVSDRIKQTLPSKCLKHVLSTEGDKWLTPEKLTDIMDVYMNSRVDLTRNVTMSGRPTKPYLSGNEGLPTKQTSNKAVSSASMPEKKMLKCFRCAQIKHRAADCRTVIPTNPRTLPSSDKNLAIANRSRISCAHNSSRASP